MAYADEVLADTPLAYWKLNDASASTSALDSGGSSRTLTHTNGHEIAQPVANADNSTRLTAGSSQYLEIADAAWEDLAGTFTLEAWVFPTALSGSRTIISKMGGAHASYYMQAVNGTGEVEFAFYTAASYTGYQAVFAPVGTLAVGRPTHLVGTYDGATMRIYANGALVASAAKTGSAYNSTDPLRLGTGNVTNYWTGMLDEVAVYSTTLSEARVLAHYEAGRKTPTTYAAEALADCPLGYWTLADTGASAVDTAGDKVRDFTYLTGLTKNQAEIVSPWAATGAVVTDGTAGVAWNDTYNAVWVNDTGFSWEAWVNPTTDGAKMGVIHRANFSNFGAAEQYGMNLRADGQAEAFIQIAGSVYNTAISPLGWVRNRDYHMVMTWDGTTLRLYVNGHQGGQVATVRPLASFDATADTHWGHQVNSTPARVNRLTGTMDNVAFYAHALPRDRIQAHYDAGEKVTYADTPAGGFGSRLNGWR